MKIVVIGATGNIGKVAAETLAARGHEVVRASRSSDNPVDITDRESISDLFSQVGDIDAVIVSVGAATLRHVTKLTAEDFLSGFTGKTLAQIEVAQQALRHVKDGGSVTLTSGVSAREPIGGAAVAAVANSALEGYTITAAAEAPRGIRVNAVSPNILANSPHFEPYFVGQPAVPDGEVGRAFVLATEGIINGRVLAI